MAYLQASWERSGGPDDASFLRLFTDHECPNKASMLVCLGEEDTASTPIEEDTGSSVERVRDMKTIREFLSCNQVTQLPAIVLLHAAAPSTVRYAPVRASEACDALTDGIEGSDALFQRAMDAYEQFDIVSSAKL